MELSDPPIGLAAVQRFYSPLELTEYSVQCGSRVFNVTSHVKAAPNIKTFFAEVNARNLAGLIHTWDGCYNPRPKRLSSQPSMHSLGAAFDINAGTNPQGGTPTMDRRLVALGRELGFFWGGDFRAPYTDGMHFQLGTDFALGGRPIPAVTYNAEAAGVSVPQAATAGQGQHVQRVKVFKADGSQVLFLEVPCTARIEAGTLIVSEVS